MPESAGRRKMVPGEPYCGSCGYVLAGLTHSARCPECGKPLVDVLMRGGMSQSRRAVRIKSESTVFGWPLYHVAFGPRVEAGEIRGVAKGVIAIGDVAYGGVAVGGFAVGVIAVGGCGIGLCAAGGSAIGLLTAAGGGAIGGIAVGGGAVGGLATGGGAVGFAAQGGGAAGVYARGAQAHGLHTIDPRGADPEAVAMFDRLSLVMGPRWSAPSPLVIAPVASVLLIDLVVLLLIGCLILVGRRSPPANPFAALGTQPTGTPDQPGVRHDP